MKGEAWHKDTADEEQKGVGKGCCNTLFHAAMQGLRRAILKHSVRHRALCMLRPGCWLRATSRSSGTRSERSAAELLLSPPVPSPALVLGGGGGARGCV